MDDRTIYAQIKMIVSSYVEDDQVKSNNIIQLKELVSRLERGNCSPEITNILVNAYKRYVKWNSSNMDVKYKQLKFTNWDFKTFSSHAYDDAVMAHQKNQHTFNFMDTINSMYPERERKFISGEKI